MSSHSERYCPVPDSMFNTPFRDFYTVFSNAEAKFDLVFRHDDGVPLWVANRVRFYYDIVIQLGIYDLQNIPSAPREVSSTSQRQELAPLAPLDLYVQTGATGPATTNRTRPFGCIYTEGFVKRALDQGRDVLLVHDAPDKLERHDHLQAITTSELRERARAAARNPKIAPVVFDAETRDFWETVANYFLSELGVKLPDIEQLQVLARSYKQQFAWHKAFLNKISPDVMICMAHYYRVPQIAAAKLLKIRTIDYQHAINSRYHLGYGYAGIHPEQRNIPCFPDEFWAWGDIWVDSSWFPAQGCDVRLVDHPAAAKVGQHAVQFEDRPERVILVATSWAMRSLFKSFIGHVAPAHPEWTFRLKLHPRELLSDYSDVEDAYDNVELVSGETDILEAGGAVRYVISICSSSLFDVLTAGCRIAVLRLPSVEYAEDFVRQFEVPVLLEDGSNLAETIEAMDSLEVPLKSVFHRMSEIERTLLDESISISHESFRLERLSGDIPRGWVEKCLAKWAALTFSAPALHNQLVAGWGSPLVRFLASYERRFFRHRYLLALLQVLKETDDLSKSARLIIDLTKAGITPAHTRGRIRDIIRDDGKTVTSGRVADLLTTIEDSPHSNAKPLAAEVFEYCVKSRASKNVKPSKLWPVACEKLSSLTPVTRRFAEHYARMATTAAAEYSDTRISRGEADALRDHIVQRLKSGEPLSMIRVGDGEAYAFDPPYVPSSVLQADRSLRERIWWGREASEAIRARLRRDCQTAILSADLLGPPSIWRLLRDIPRLLLGMRGPIAAWPATARAHRILFEEFERFELDGRLDWSAKTLIDERCNQEIFDIGDLAAFSVIDRPRVLINCFSAEQVNAALEQPFFTHSIRLPPHTKVRAHVPDDSLARSFTPALLDELLAQMDPHIDRGAVFYVAGGLVGKILIGRASAQGAAALDIGAAADYWMGLETRGRLDFTNFGRSTKD